MNRILERLEEEVKTEFTGGLVVVLDSLGGRVDDTVAMWKVRRLAGPAWTNAQVLWGLRSLPPLRDKLFSDLDGLVGLMGRGLLQPRDPTLLRYPAHMRNDSPPACGVATILATNL